MYKSSKQTTVCCCWLNSYLYRFIKRLSVFTEALAFLPPSMNGSKTGPLHNPIPSSSTTFAIQFKFKMEKRYTHTGLQARVAFLQHFLHSPLESLLETEETRALSTKDDCFDIDLNWWCIEWGAWRPLWRSQKLPTTFFFFKLPSFEILKLW